MEELFLEIVRMSISASWLILAVILLRFLLGKAPKGVRYILWALVAIRLVCPFSVESGFSLIPDVEAMVAEKIPEEYLEKDTAYPSQDNANIIPNDTNDIQIGINTSLPGTETIVPGNNTLVSGTNTPETNTTGNHNSVVPENNDVMAGNSQLPQQSGQLSAEDVQKQMEGDGLLTIVSRAWGIVGICLLIYMIFSYVYLWKKVRVSIPIGDHQFICDEIRSPFILGIVRPRIYLPSYIEKKQMTYIVAHEKEHLKCLDYLWKPLGFLILSLHWFNPFAWIAYILLCRDLELACDERVIRNMDAQEKRNYSEVLLLCSSPRHLISACPVAFGEVGIKERIKKVLLYKKPAAWIVGIAVVLCVVIGICFLTDPESTSGTGNGKDETELQTEESETETEEEKEEESYGFQIQLPEGVRIGKKLVYEELEGWFLEVDGYNPMEKYPYAEENTLWFAPGWIYSYEGELSYSENGVYIPDWRCSFKDFETYFGVTLCTVQADVYSGGIWLEHSDELSYDAGYTYYWALIFENREPGSSYGQVNWVLLNQDCFTKAEAITIGTSFVPDYENEVTDNPKEDAEVDYEEIVIYETTADLTHDGIIDKVQTVLYSYDGDREVDSYSNPSVIKVFRGKSDGSYEKNPSYISEEYCMTHAANETVVLTKKDGKDYLMFSEMYEMNGEASYYYTVMFIGKDNQEEVVDTDKISFACHEYSDLWFQYSFSKLRGEVVPGLRQRMESWIANGTILLSFDISTPAYVSTAEHPYPANVYYDQIWNRVDREDFPEGTSYKVAYQYIIDAFQIEYGDGAERLLYSLVDFNDDDTPELLIGILGFETSMYTYHDGKIYPLMRQWGYGAGGNAGYFYIPKQNVLYSRDADYAGMINYLTIRKIDENYQFVDWAEKTLSYGFFNDLDGNGMPSEEEHDGKVHYFYGEKEITEEEFGKYLPEGITREEILDYSYGQFVDMVPEKTLDEILEELK